MRRFWIGLLLALLPSAAFAGGSTAPGIVQSGTVTAGHCAQFSGNGVAIDAGTTCGTGTAGVSQSQGTANQVLVNGDTLAHTGATTYSLPNAVTLGAPGVSLGSIGLAGSTSGTATIEPPAVAGTPTITLPAVSGSLLSSANNLSDLGSAATARTNLGLGTAATVNTGTSGSLIPLLSTANTWSLGQTFSAAPIFGSITGATQCLHVDATGAVSGTGSDCGSGGGSGTVTSVGLSLPNIFTVTGSPVTTSGTLTGALATQSANTIFAGPASGVAAAPIFRPLVPADLPLFSSTQAGAVPSSGGGTANFLRADGTWVAPSGSGTVNSGTSGQLAGYSATGNAVSGFTVGAGLAVNGTTLTTTAPVSIKTGAYTVATTDAGSTIVLNSASAATFTIPAAATMGAGTTVCFANEGAGALTLSITTSSAYGLLSSVLPQNASACLQSDGTNYAAFQSNLPLGSEFTITSGTLHIASSGINLASQVTGNLPVANLNSGTGASSSTFWRGDGIWATPSGGGNVSGPVSSTIGNLASYSNTSGTGIQDTGIASANVAQLNVSQSWTKGQAVTPTAGGTQTAGGTYTPDFSSSNSVTLTFGAGNLTIANPTNIKAGQPYVISLTQDATGGRTVTWGTDFKWAGGTAPTLSTAANADDIISCWASSTTFIACSLAVKGAQ